MASQPAPTLFGHSMAITPHDSTNYTEGEAQAIWVGGAGNVAVVKADGTVAQLNGCPAGSVIPMRSIRVNSTNTTATVLVALYVTKGKK